MRTVPTGRGTEIVEIPDVTHCSGCGHRFEPPAMTTSWSNCSCTKGSHGHRIFICLRGTCRAETFDPPHVGGEEHHPLSGHGHAPASWDDVQHGPTADFGDF